MMARRFPPLPPEARPELAESHRLGSDTFVAVRAEYVVKRQSVPVVETPAGPVIVARRTARTRIVELETVLGQGGTVAQYAPFVHAEIPGEIAKLRTGGSEAILAFARSYGHLGFCDLAQQAGWHPNEFLAVDPRTGSRTLLGDPLIWIRAHGWGIHICLEITDALARGIPQDALRKLLNSWNGVFFAAGIAMCQVMIDWQGETPSDTARQWRRRIINSNLSGIYRYIGVDETSGTERSFFGFVAPISVAYWHLANVVDGGRIKRCEARGCGAMFIQTDPRQRFCPKRWRQRESACALRQRQRAHRKGR